jgi:DNA-binding transcriptional LysR family regulator
MEQLIANGQLDFGVTYVPFPMENVEIIEIRKYRLGCYHLKNTFEEQQISEIPFVAPAHDLSSSPLGIKERDGWLESIYPRNKTYSVNLLSTAIELTLQGLCATYIPNFIAQRTNTSRRTKELLIEHPLPKNQNNIQRAFLLKHKDQTEDAIFKQIYRMMKEAISCKP